MPCASYLQSFFRIDKRRKLLRRGVKALRPMKFDSIAVRGVSGLTFGSALAAYLNKKIAVVRKGETRHSEYMVESVGTVGTYVIVDDLIDLGGTVNAIVDAIRDTEPGAECCAIVLYSDRKEYPKNEWRGYPLILLDPKVSKFANQKGGK